MGNKTLNQMFVNSVTTPYFFPQKKNEKGECGKVLSKFGNREFLPVGFSSAVFLSAGGFVTLSLSQI